MLYCYKIIIIYRERGVCRGGCRKMKGGGLDLTSLGLYNYMPQEKYTA